MYGMTTLGTVMDTVTEMSRHHFDEHIPVRDVSFDSLDVCRIDNEPHRLRPAAQQQICNRLGVPITYMRKCTDKLQQENLNYWIEKERNDTLFFRFDGADIRAVFTPRYTPVDNMAVLHQIERVGCGPDTRVQCSLDDELMAVSIPDSNKTFAVNGDRITPGISVSNSEVGMSSVHITAFYLRLVCTNGLIAKTSMCSSYRHISTRILENFGSVFHDVESGLYEQIGSFRISLESPVHDPMSSLTAFNRQFGLCEVEQKAVEWARPSEAGDTMFNVIQTYTRASQMPGLSAESRIKLQQTGGNILALVQK